MNVDIHLDIQVDIPQIFSKSSWLSHHPTIARREVGTVGVTSPLFDVDKAFKALAEEAEDPEAYVELLERFTKAGHRGMGNDGWNGRN